MEASLNSDIDDSNRLKNDTQINSLLSRMAQINGN
mgnify:CR=1 FL=1